VDVNLIGDREKYRLEARAGCFNPIAVGSATTGAETSILK